MSLIVDLARGNRFLEVPPALDGHETIVFQIKSARQVFDEERVLTWDSFELSLEAAEKLSIYLWDQVQEASMKVKQEKVRQDSEDYHRE